MSARWQDPLPDVPRRRTETLVLVALIWCTAAALTLPVSRAAATWLTGQDWVWPTSGAALVESIGGLAAGRPAAGLTATQAAVLPGPGWIYALLAAAELLLVAAAVWSVWRWWHTSGPGVLPGMATPGEVTELLGRSRLHRVAGVIRPDLDARRRAHRPPLDRREHDKGWG